MSPVSGSWWWTTNPAFAALLARVLALADYEVDVAANGHEALDRVRDHRCHLLITDIEMPEMNGLDVGQ